MTNHQRQLLTPGQHRVIADCAEAYRFGQKHRRDQQTRLSHNQVVMAHNDWSETRFGGCPAEHTLVWFLAGYDNLTAPKVVSGWRYGAPLNSPDYDGCRRSFNHRDQIAERGISMAVIHHNPKFSEWINSWSAQWWDPSSPKVRIRGLLLPYSGSDGEALIYPGWIY